MAPPPPYNAPLLPSSSWGFLMKVCETCIYWTPEFTGRCSKLELGVGKFFFCELYTATNSINQVENLGGLEGKEEPEEEGR